MNEESGRNPANPVYFMDRYGFFHKFLNQSRVQETAPNIATEFPLSSDAVPKASSTWLRLIIMFWNPRVMKAAVRFGVAALVMNQYERLGFAVFLLCFAL